MSWKQFVWFAFSVCIVLQSAPTLAVDGPVKVFILAGQSNMEGHAKIETFDYIGDDPATAPLLAQMLDENGQPRDCEGVWISFLTGRGDENAAGQGKLTAGYGARTNPLESNGKIGPEFTFGLTMDQAFKQPVLIIKTAWGGKSLFHDFRSPSSGVFQQSEKDKEVGRHTPETSGHYYRLMTEHVHAVLADIEQVIPEYDPTQGYEIAGFVWFQGWNDMVNRDVYPMPAKGTDANRFATYSQLLANLIRDVRRDFDAPKMPFVIGVMGVDGDLPNEGNQQFRDAMASVAEMPEFVGNVVAVATAPFWDRELGKIDDKYAEVRQMGYYLRTKHKDYANKDGEMSEDAQRNYLKKFESELISAEEVALRERGASNAGYHYLGCAKTFARMGQAFAKACLNEPK